MNTPPDFSKYAKQLNIEQLKKQGTQALADELSYTRQLYESLDTIFQDSLDGFFITDGEGNVLKVTSPMKKCPASPVKRLSVRICMTLNLR